MWVLTTLPVRAEPIRSTASGLAVTMGSHASSVSALRAAYTDAGKRMATIIETEAKTPVDARTCLRRVVYEGLPLDAARLREWKVWIVREDHPAGVANDPVDRIPVVRSC